MGIYPKSVYTIGRDRSVLQIERVGDKNVKVKPELPGTVIAVHGVNDVGVGYESVEGGLCEGMMERLNQGMVSGKYRLPKPEDARKLEPDPDAVFFKRTVDENTHSPVVPFYWGYREYDGKYRSGKDTPHGQAMDRYDNRLDKDFSKGGGPFANATGTLPDMWGKGKGNAFGFLDWLNGDPLRPVLKNPGRLYMILAARRLAALISMIRDYDEDETVSIVAHSQGCMLSLLAQAFLQQQGLRPADTLVLTHPPYSLVDDVPWTADLMELSTSGEDAVMEGRYGSIAGLQTLHARLSTLANTVQQVVAARHEKPSFGSLKDSDRRGVVGTKWEAGADRDNRGKVYLYFCPEDMTVALQNVQGIGWQGVPDHIEGSRLQTVRAGARPGERGSGGLQVRPVKGWREPMREIGAGFFQRVFTAKRRPDLLKGKAVMIGAAPHDFALRVEGETSFEHAANMTHFYNGDRIARTKQQLAHDPEDASASPQRRREGWRTINGERLRQPVEADLCAGGIAVGKDKNSAKDADADKPDPGAPDKVLKGEPGSYEWLDPVDAAVAVTSQFAGIGDQGGKFGDDNTRWILIDDPTFDPSKGKRPMWTTMEPGASPHPATYAGSVVESSNRTKAAAQEAINEGQPNTGRRTVLKAYECLGEGEAPSKLLLHCTESPDETRLRWQQSTAPRSFHSAIFGSRTNHRNVTSYDVAVAQGKAPTDPRFRDYLCAVADWRLKDVDEQKEKSRLGILKLSQFIQKFESFLACELPWRKELIFGNCVYYSTGVLPALPVLPEGLPPGVICETMKSGVQPMQPIKPVTPVSSSASDVGERT